MAANPTPTGERRSDFVQSLQRGLSVIRAFRGERQELTLSEVARATGLSRAAARRFLLTLVELGYVHASDGRFTLGPRVLDLGYAYLSSLGVLETVEPHLDVLGRRTGESCSVSVLDDTEIVYLTPSRRAISVTRPVGSRLPSHATAMGRVLLAALPDRELEERVSRMVLEPLTVRTVTDRHRLVEIVRSVRARGYAVVEEELEEGLVAAAVPVRVPWRAVVAAINIAGRVSPGVLEHELLPLLKETAAAIERDLRAVYRADG